MKIVNGVVVWIKPGVGGIDKDQNCYIDEYIGYIFILLDPHLPLTCPKKPSTL